MEKKKWIACSGCGDIIGAYNEDIERDRKKAKFLSYCVTCESAVKPIYL